MNYRRPHHRRAHTRTNPDGSKSHVSESFVKGHNVNNKKQHYYSNSRGDYDLIDVIVSIVMLFGIACLILLLLGMLLMWETGEVVAYGIGFFVSLVVFLIYLHKR